MTAQKIADRFFKTLDHLEYGQFNLVTPDGKTRSFEGANPGPSGTLVLNDWKVLPNLLLKGDVGFADDYKAGLWETTNLQNLLTLALKNERTISPYIAGSRLAQMLAQVSYFFRRNTEAGSRKNIHAHYDLGNDFYKLWLDPGMTYSSGIFPTADITLEQSQLNKYDRILGRLGRSSGSLLEIGCGWGAFAERASHKGDYTIKGVTISQAQHDYAQKRLQNNAKILMEDYRSLQGRFQNIVSIEMFEAVGEKYWPTYFSKLKSLLAEKGTAVLQTITIEDSRFEAYRKGGDVIRSFVFPGGMLPAPGRFAEEAARAGLQINDTFEFGQDYATTLERWLANFDARKAEVKALGFDDKFIRLWRFYLAACIAGFKTGRTGVMQVELQHA